MKRQHFPSREIFAIVVISLALIIYTSLSIEAFVVVHSDAWTKRRCSAKPDIGYLLFSSVGGGSTPPGEGDRDSSNQWDDFLNPKMEESDNLFYAREFMSENSLPISHGLDDNDKDTDFEANDEDEEEVSAIVGLNDFTGGLSKEALASNPYINVVSKLSPSELISKFTSTAHPRVQNAVRSTILGLIGGLPKMAFDTSTITTGQKLASLMFQLQMTGYMFKNAEYRLSVQQSLGVDSDQYSSESLILAGSGTDGNERIDPLEGKVKGKLRIKYSPKPISPAKEIAESIGSSDGGAFELEVDAAAYMSELRNEVEQLRNELALSQKKEEDAMRKDLLQYIRTLPPTELQSLTNTMSQDVLLAMKGLVNAVLSGIGEGQISPDTITEQSGEAMAQLCMWQLVIGYNLRTLEVRDEIRSSLNASGDSSNGESGVDLTPGALE